MNTSPISHRMFVAALAHAGPPPEKAQPNARDAQAKAATRTGPAAPSNETLAAWAARPWVNWPFISAWEKGPAS